MRVAFVQFIPQFEKRCVNLQARLLPKLSNINLMLIKFLKNSEETRILFILISYLRIILFLIWIE